MSPFRLEGEWVGQPLGSTLDKGSSLFLLKGPPVCAGENNIVSYFGETFQHKFHFDAVPAVVRYKITKYGTNE